MSDDVTPDSDTPAATDPLAAARQRYEHERTKRLRADGLSQFQELKGKFADFDRDPYADPDAVGEPVDESPVAVIVGGGFAGMFTAIRLKEKGINDFRIVEKAGDFGGTWYWNRYPGCMCDVESYTYMPFLEETGYMPTEKYASAPEIFAHCQRIARHFDLYPHALFQASVESATWDADANRWDIATTRGDRLRPQFFISAAGLLHKAKLPGIPGIEDYEGHTFHTSRWDYDYTGGSPTEPMDNLADKRVGIIGTGATAIQAVPRLAEAAKELYVFQRTPAAVGVRGNGPTDEEWFRSLEPGWQAPRMENFTEAATGEQPDPCFVKDGWVEAMWTNTQMATGTPEGDAELERIDFEYMEQIRARVDEIIDDPETAELLKPWYGKHCKRITFHDEYLPAFNQPHVHLVDTDGLGVQQVSEAGVVVAGKEYPVDLLIFASGFEVTTGFVQRIGFDPVGRDGVPLSEHWHNGGHTLHGVLAAEFPNMLIIGTMQASYGTNFVHFLLESTAHIAWLVETCLDRRIATIEATPEAEDEWLMTLFGAAMGMADYNAVCTPSYYNSEGQSTEREARNVVHPGNLAHYVKHLDEWKAAGDLPGTRTTSVDA